MEEDELYITIDRQGRCILEQEHVINELMKENQRLKATRNCLLRYIHQKGLLKEMQDNIKALSNSDQTTDNATK